MTSTGIRNLAPGEPAILFRLLRGTEVTYTLVVHSMMPAARLLTQLQSGTGPVGARWVVASTVMFMLLYGPAQISMRAATLHLPVEQPQTALPSGTAQVGALLEAV